ncbi:MAG: PqqD family protein [Lachnospiraceae bacterium]|nr:PqqD family protein [Lachnospiraceae bacterium]
MKPAENFSLQYLSGVPYLLPYGQAIADRKRGLRLNEAGAFLWKALQNTTDRETLLAGLAAHYGADSAEMDRLSEDLSAFLSELRVHGLLTEGDTEISSKTDCAGCQQPIKDEITDLQPNSENRLSSSQYNIGKRTVDSRHDHHFENKNTDSTAIPADSSIDRKILRIGGERIRIQAPAKLLNDALLAFQDEEAAASGPDFHLKVTAASDFVCDLEVDVSPLSNVSGHSGTSVSTPSIGHREASDHRVCLPRDPQLCVSESESSYDFSFPSAQQLSCGEIAKDGSRAAFYYRLAPDPASDIGGFPGEILREEFFHSLRLAFLYHVQKKGMFAIHSASILYQGKAWLFSGHSGMGKSTHARLWTQLYETPQLNGDLNLLAIAPEGPMVYGMPWCGTSGIFTKQTYPLGGIILLKQNQQDFCEELSPDQKTLLLTQRLISPAWTEELLSLNLRFADRLKDQILVCRLHCTKEPSAAETMKSRIDR